MSAPPLFSTPLHSARFRYLATRRSAEAAQATFEERRRELVEPSRDLPPAELEKAEEAHDLAVEQLREEVGLPPRQRALLAAEDELIDSYVAFLRRGAACDPDLQQRLAEVEPGLAVARRRLRERAELVAVAEAVATGFAGTRRERSRS